MVGVKLKVKPKMASTNRRRANVKNPKQSENIRIVLRVKQADLFNLYMRSPSFQHIMDSGFYVYLDGYFVLKPIAIAILKAQKKHNIVSTLKEFGLSGKATDYCISYECGEKYASNLVDTRYIHPRYFISLHVVHAGKVSHFNDDLSSDDIELRQFVGRNYVTNDGGPPSFSELLKLYMSEKCVTVEQLAESSGLDPKTIQRYRNDPNIRPALNSVIAICLGLHLLPTDSIALIHSAGYTLRNIERERAYLFVINTCYDQSIHICNELLKRNGFDPII